MAFRRWIAGDIVSRHGIDELWKENVQAARRTMAIMKSAKTLERLTIADLDRPEKVLQERKNKR